MDERELRKYLGNVHVGDEVEIVYEEIGRLGFSDNKKTKCRGYVLMIDNADIYLSLRDPIGLKERKFSRKIEHNSVISYKMIRNVDG